MSLSSFVSLAGGILGLLGLVGSAVAVLLQGRQKATITTLQDHNRALVDRMETLETTEADCKARLGHLEQVNKVLTETVTSAAAVRDLDEKLDGHHREVVRRLDKLGASS